MNEFDLKAAGWDENPMHADRAKTIASRIRQTIPLRGNMTALEFGAGTGLTSFFLASELGKILMMDSSAEMVKKMEEKILASGLKNLNALKFDLEHDDFNDEKFDLIFTQMVLHHITDIEGLFIKFRKLLNPGGYLAIADLYTENGSFHGENFTGHKGFDPNALAAILKHDGFINIAHDKCYTLEKNLTEGGIAKFDIFLLTCQLK